MHEISHMNFKSSVLFHGIKKKSQPFIKIEFKMRKSYTVSAI